MRRVTFAWTPWLALVVTIALLVLDRLQFAEIKRFLQSVDHRRVRITVSDREGASVPIAGINTPPRKNDEVDPLRLKVSVDSDEKGFSVFIIDWIGVDPVMLSVSASGYRPAKVDVGPATPESVSVVLDRIRPEK